MTGKTSTKIGILVLFLMAGLILVSFFPRKGKFRFEFQKGKPWMHETLVAPFDFPIYKPENAIKVEKDSIEKTCPPFFRYDNQATLRQISLFRKNFQQKWDVFEKKQREAVNLLNVPKDLERLRTDYFDIFSRLVDEILVAGIVDPGELARRTNPVDGRISFVKDNISGEVAASTLFNPRTAREYLVLELSRIRSELIREEAEYFVQPPGFYNFFDLSEYLIPNIFPDDATWKKEISQRVEQISLTEGMVASGEKIIARGDIVGPRDYQVLLSLKNETEIQIGTAMTFRLIMLGQILLVGSILLIFYLYLHYHRRDIRGNPKKILFLLMIMVLFILATVGVSKNQHINIYIVPFGLLPLIIRSFFDSKLAIYTHILAVLLVGFFVPNGFEFVFIQFVAGLMGVFVISGFRKRAAFFLVAMAVSLAYCLAFFGIDILQEGSLEKIDYYQFAWFGANGLLMLLAFPLIFLFEKIFGFISEVTLLELSDTNNKLLRQMAEVAPGTFQHSLQVANLAEEVVFNIGGDTLLVRAGALYHDIGKMHMAAYFIENQIQGNNPHDKLDFEKSAQIIIGHVSEGIKMARRHKLPEGIIDFIRTHHGTTKVRYFYNSFVNKFPDAEVNVDRFTYPGPIPFSKETAALMMADSCEAASRSLKSYSGQSISDLVDRIIDYQQSEGQYNNSDITFKDVSIAREILKKKLINIYHNRIEYPGVPQSI